MPRAVYIICSESGAEDERTRLVSHFNVIERVELTKLKVPETPVGGVQQSRCPSFYLPGHRGVDENRGRPGRPRI
jgi:hypothetical protein